MRRQLSVARNAIRRAARQDRTDEILVALGGLQCALLDVRRPASLNAAEFKVFSQFGEDGAIQHLLRQVEVPSSTFVEIGVESYRESNTRFLALHDNWRGLAVDGSSDHLEFITSTDIGWRADVQAVRAFVTRENINELLSEYGYDEELGLLSIDVDGMDYWLLEGLEVVRPAIIVIEYNSIFGPTAKVTVPYTSDFVCSRAHWSHQYFGASLAALEDLASSRGYALVGATKNAVNAFFVRADLVGTMAPVHAATAWRPSRFLSARHESGALAYVRAHEDRLRLIADLPLYEVETGAVRSIRDLYKL